MARSEQEGAVQGIKDPAKRKAAYYKLQREHAEESGDQATTDKIYGKLGKKSHNVDTRKGDKAILGVAPFLPEAVAGLGEMAAARGAASLGKMIPRLGKGAESQSSRALVPRVEGTSQVLRKPTPVDWKHKTLFKGAPTDKEYAAQDAARVRQWESEGRAEYAKKGKKALASPKKALPSNKKAPAVGKVRAVSGGSRQANKALTSSGHGDYNAELAKQTQRSKVPGGKKGAVRGSRKKSTPKV